MLICHRKNFFAGILLLASFFVMFYLMLMPLLRDADGQRLTLLQYADEAFNELSKGSSYFIPQVRESAERITGKDANLSIKVDRPALLPLMEKLLRMAGAEVEIDGEKLAFSGDLGKILLAATDDSDLLYLNEGAKIKAKYGVGDPCEITSAWWRLLNPCVLELQKKDKLAEANAITATLTRAIEPANNFYGIKAAHMSGNVLLVCALLAFYLLYTIWYGFGIYELFDGIGMLGKNAKTEKTEEKS